MNKSMEFVKNAWINEVSRNMEVDPYGELCWESLSIGFALGNGLDIVDAKKLVSELLKEGLL